MKTASCDSQRTSITSWKIIVTLPKRPQFYFFYFFEKKRISQERSLRKMHRSIVMIKQLLSQFYRKRTRASQNMLHTWLSTPFWPNVTLRRLQLQSIGTVRIKWRVIVTTSLRWHLPPPNRMPNTYPSILKQNKHHSTSLRCTF